MWGRTITGYYYDDNGAYHGFVRSNKKGNAITTFDASGAGTGSGQGTGPYSINASGVIAGSYRNADNTEYGFVRAADGTITSFFDSNYAGSYGYGINSARDRSG